MSKKDEQINLLEYAYPDGVTVEIPGRLLEGLMQTIKQVVDNETYQGFTDTYPKTVQEVKGKESKLIEEVKLELTPYPTAQSYFSQEPQKIKTMLGVMCEDLLLFLKQIHLDSINEGKAQKIGTLKPKNKDAIKLSSEPTEQN